MIFLQVGITLSDEAVMDRVTLLKPFRYPSIGTLRVRVLAYSFSGFFAGPYGFGFRD